MLKTFEAGADVLVAGNAVFASENPERTIELMEKKKILKLLNVGCGMLDVNHNN